MLDKKVSFNKYEFNILNVNKKIHIKNISDLHLCKSFDIEKLAIIEEYIFKTPCDYLIISGDVIDSTNFIYEDETLVEIYIKWFKKIGNKVKIFIALGSHDFSYFKKRKWYSDLDNNIFWKKLSDINNIYVSHYNNYYEDDNIVVLMLEPGYDYYHEYKRKESKEILLNTIKNTNKLNNLSKNKLKILVNHSPVFMLDKKVLKFTKNYDLVLSGHMHLGAIPLGLDKLLPGNRGIISPKRTLLPKYSRGVVYKEISDKLNQILLISGGITKIQECSGFKSLNHLYYMDIEDIIINKKK